MKKGYYKEDIIELTVLRGSGSPTAPRRSTSLADVGISDAPTVPTAISKGQPEDGRRRHDKAGNNVFFKKSANIKSPKDLAGKKIAVPPADSHRVLWPAFAATQGIDANSVTMVNVKPEGKQAIVAAGEVDASFDLYTSYAIWEKVLGKGEVGHLLWADYGLPIYGHTYFVNNDLVKKNPKLIERFLRATHKGWRDAKANPAASIDAMVEQVAGLDRATLLATMPAILDLCVTERSSKHGLGWIEPELTEDDGHHLRESAKPSTSRWCSPTCSATSTAAASGLLRRRAFSAVFDAHPAEPSAGGTRARRRRRPAARWRSSRRKCSPWPSRSRRRAATRPAGWHRRSA